MITCIWRAESSNCIHILIQFHATLENVMVQLAHCRYMFPYFNSEPDVWKLVTSITLVSPLLPNKIERASEKFLPAYSCFNPLWFVCFLFVCLFFCCCFFFFFFFLFFFCSFVCLFVCFFVFVFFVYCCCCFFPQKISFGQKKIRKCTIHHFCATLSVFPVLWP